MDRAGEYRSGSNQSESYPGAYQGSNPVGSGSISGALRGGYGGEPREANCSKDPGSIRQRLMEKCEVAHRSVMEAETAKQALGIIERHPELLTLIESLQRLGMLRSY